MHCFGDLLKFKEVKQRGSKSINTPILEIIYNARAMINLNTKFEMTGFTLSEIGL